MTAAYLARVENYRAHTAAELGDALGQASDASVFYHTFQTLNQHHFLTEGFSNDFAQWVLAGLNQPALAERLASIDVRDYLSIAELRADLRRIIGSFCEEHSSAADQRAFEPFYFCQAVEVTEALPWDAKTLSGFRAGLERLSHASFYYHFIGRGFEIFRDYNRRNMENIPLDSRFIVIHDPQPAPFIDKQREGAGQHWIWRCHIDLSRPDPNVWNFLEPWVNRYEAAIFSSPELFAAVADPAVPVLSVHRSSVGQESRSGTRLRGQCARTIRNRQDTADSDAEFAFRSL